MTDEPIKFMNALDWLLVILLAYSVVRAFLRGFFQEAFALGGLILGFLFACWFYRPLAADLKGLIPPTQIAELAAFLLILAGTMILASLLGRLFRHTASAIGLGFVDRFLGGAFGLVRGALLGVALLVATTAFLPSAPWIENSHLAPYFLRAAHAVSFVMPSDLKRRLLDEFNHLKHMPPDWIKGSL
ncbi:MAG: CvpA family protein [Acidobacteriaceae bacterium]|jgi:membrane protein required for colicin V production